MLIRHYSVIRSIIISILINSSLSATIINVPADQTTIQAGINSAMNGDTVLVQPGTYIENITWPGTNGIKLIGIDESTSIIDGGQNASVIRFEDDESFFIDSLTLIKSFTITNGYSQGDWPAYYGGGIYFGTNANPKVMNVTISNNHAYWSGGGIYCESSSPIFVNLTVTGNTTSIDGPNGHGGGACIRNSNAIFLNSIFNDNIAWKGGGLACDWNSNPIIDSVSIINNTASSNRGGGIDFSNNNFILKNSFITDNIGNGISTEGTWLEGSIINCVIARNTGSGVFHSGGQELPYQTHIINSTITENISSNDSAGGVINYSGFLNVMSSIIWNNYPEEIHSPGNGEINITYSLIGGGSEEIIGTVNWLDGNINLNPCFINPSDNNLYLFDYSPCIGAGIDSVVINGTWLYAPLTDIEGNPRPNPQGSNPDMGAYENTMAEPVMIPEVHNLDVGGQEDITHLTNHTPEVSFTYYIDSEEPQTNYQVQVSSFSNFSNIDMWDTGDIVSSDTLIEYDGNTLFDGQDYYLRVRIASGDFWSEWSTLSFHMNSIPSIPAPVNPIEDQVVDEPINLVINSSADPENDYIQYQYYIYDDNSHEVFVDSSGLISDTTWQIQVSLSDNNQYWWYAKSYDGYESSDLAFAESFLVNTQNNVPGDFSLILPGNNDELTTLSPTFSWYGSYDPDPLDTVRYTLYLDTPEPWILSYVIGTDTTWQISEPLIDNQEYYWKVIAEDILGFETENISGYHRFIVNSQNEPPSEVTIISPDSVIVLSLYPELNWTEAIDPDPNDSITYEVHWGGEFMQPQSIETDTNLCIITYVVDNAEHYWYIISKDQHGSTSESRHAPFWVDATPEPPFAFTTVSPSYSETGLDNEVTFIWNKAIDPDPFDHVSYYLSYWSDSLPVEHIPEIMDTSIVVYIPEAGTYYWMITAYDEDNFYVESNDSVPSIFTIGFVNVVDDVLIPDVFTLNQNYPNPFNPITTIRYDLPEKSHVTITIYDILGSHVKTLINQTQDAGHRLIKWDATNFLGQSVGAGMYFYHIKAGNFTQTRKMVLLR